MPPQTRFGLRTSALAAVHEAQVAGNGHTAWSLMQPARLKGQGFIMQELPLPLVSAPSGESKCAYTSWRLELPGSEQ